MKKFKEINGKPYCLNSINYMAPIQSNCILNILMMLKGNVNTTVNDFVTQKCIIFQCKGIQDRTVHSFSDDIWRSSCSKVS